MTSQHRIVLVDGDPSILRLALFCLEGLGLAGRLEEATSVFCSWADLGYDVFVKAVG
jgi:hypothetical protein